MSFPLIGTDFDIKHVNNSNKARYYNFFPYDFHNLLFVLTHAQYVLGLGLYSKILDSKKLVDFWKAEYSLEITLKEKSQTRLARTRKSSFE